MQNLTVQILIRIQIEKLRESLKNKQTKTKKHMIFHFE